jgi:hypothetical protein
MPAKRFILSVWKSLKRKVFLIERVKKTALRQAKPWNAIFVFSLKNHSFLPARKGKKTKKKGGFFSVLCEALLLTIFY